jgi:hypothetical protein
MRYTWTRQGLSEERPMKTFGILFALTVVSISPAFATDGCGPGCHATIYGACVVDGWGTGANVWNACPVTTRPRPPCAQGFIWNRRFRACAQTVKDWI